jgi:hypothetical protein
MFLANLSILALSRRLPAEATVYFTHPSPEFLAQIARELGAGDIPEKLSQTVRERLTAVWRDHHANIMAKLAGPGARIH